MDRDTCWAISNDNDGSMQSSQLYLVLLGLYEHCDTGVQDADK